MQFKRIVAKSIIFFGIIIGTMMLPAFTSSIYATPSSPTVTNITKSGVKNADITFTKQDFTSAYTDPNNLPLSEIYFSVIPDRLTQGSITVNGSNINAGSDYPIYISDLDSVTFIPNRNFTGTVVCKYVASNGQQNSNEGTITITVDYTNCSPVISDVSASATEDTLTSFLTDILSVYRDAEDDTLTTIKVISLPANGLLTDNGVPIEAGAEVDPSRLQFMPNANFNGTTSFVYSVSDGNSYSNQATLNINIASVNDSPIVGTISKTSPENSDVAFTLSDFSSIFQDVDGDLMTSIKILSLPTDGKLTFNGAPVELNQVINASDINSLVFTPNLNYNGLCIFSFNASDGIVDSNPGYFYGHISPVDYPPTIDNINKSTIEDANVLFSELDFTSVYVDSDLQHLSKIKILSLPTNGTIFWAGTEVSVGQEFNLSDISGLLFVPDANFNGIISFDYSASDGNQYSDSAKVFINIVPVNDPPVAKDILKSTPKNTNVILSASDFLSAYTDVESDPLASITILSLPTNGILKLGGANGTPVEVNQVIKSTDLDQLLFIPDADFNGMVSFSYITSDGVTSSNQATINIAMNIAPTTNNIYKSVQEDAIVTFSASDFTAVYFDMNNDPLAKIKITSISPNGVLKLYGAVVSVGQEISLLNIDNLVFVTNANYNGTITFSFCVSDGILYSSDASVNITISSVEDSPSVTGIVRAGAKDSGITFSASNFTSAYSSADNRQLTDIKIMSLPSSGILNLNGIAVKVGDIIRSSDLGSLVFTPNLGYTGIVSFDYCASDGIVFSNQATISMAIIEMYNQAYLDSIEKSLSSLTLQFRPSAIAIDKSGNILVANLNSTLGFYGVSQFDPSGNLITTWFIDQQCSISKISVDSCGYIYITLSNGFIEKYTSAGVFVERLEYVPIAAVATAIDSQDNLYTVDPINGILKLDNHGNIIARIGGLGTGSNQFSNPVGIAIDSQNNIYVSDADRNIILKFDADGNFISFWGGTGSDIDKFSLISKLAVDKQGNIYAIDKGNNSVLKFDPNGNLLLIIDGQFNTPGDITVDAQNNIYISDTLNGKIQKFNSNGDFLDSWYRIKNSSISNYILSYMATDSNDNLYLIDTVTGKIQKIGPDGALIKAWQLQGNVVSSDGTIMVPTPTSIAIDSAGNVYVIDQSHGIIQKFDSNGIFIKSWGGKGTGIKEFLNPSIVRVGPNDTIYVLDNDQHLIKVFDSNGNYIMQIRIADSNVYSIVIGEDGKVYTVSEISSDSLGIIVYGSDGVMLTQLSQDLTSKVLYSDDGSSLGSLVGLSKDIYGNIYTMSYTQNLDLIIQSYDKNWNRLSLANIMSGMSNGNIYFLGSNSMTIDSQHSIYLLSFYGDIIKYSTQGQFISKLNVTLYAEQLDNTIVYGTAYDALSNRTYVAGYSGTGSQILVLDSTGRVIDAWLDSLSTAYLTIAVDKQGYVYAVSLDNSQVYTVRKFDYNGKLLESWTLFNMSTLSVKSIAVDAQNNIYVLGVKSIKGVTTSRIDVFDSNGNLLSSYEFNSQINSLTGSLSRIVIDSQNNIYGINTDSGKLIKFNAQFNYVTSWDIVDPSTGIYYYEIAIDLLDRIYVSTSNVLPNYSNLPVIKMFSSDGTLLASFGYSGPGLSHLGLIVGLTVTPSGTVQAITNDNSFSIALITPVTNTSVVHIGDIAKKVQIGNVLTFSFADFLNVYSNSNGISLENIKIVTLPDSSIGQLMLDGVPVFAGQEIPATMISKLTFIASVKLTSLANFTIQASDGYTYSNMANIFIATYQNPSQNLPPFISNITKSGEEDSNVSFVLSDFTESYLDIEGNILAMIKITSLPSNGTLMLNGSAVTIDQEISSADLAKLIFIPNANYNGTITFTYKASDGSYYSIDSKIITINIAAVNDPPVITGDILATGNQNSNSTIEKSTLLSVYSDLDNDSVVNMVITAVPTSGGKFMMNGAELTVNQVILAKDINDITFVPNNNWSGIATLSFKLSDGSSFSNVGSISITINPTIIDAPPIAYDGIKIWIGKTVTFSLSDFRYSDADGDKMTSIKINSLPCGGTLTFNGVAVKVGQIISVANISKLKFTPSCLITATSFSWSGSEDNGLTFGNIAHEYLVGLKL